MTKQTKNTTTTENITKVAVTPGTTVTLQAHSVEALYNRSNADLVVTDGETVTRYENFFAQGEGKDLPDLVLADGTVIAGKDFLKSQNPDMELTTAAGPESKGLDSSGMNSYVDNSGDMVAGVDRLDSLGTDQWNTSTLAPEDSAADLQFAVLRTGDSPSEMPGGLFPGENNNSGALPPVGGDNGGNTLPPVGGDNGNTDSNENNGGTLPPVGGDNGGNTLPPVGGDNGNTDSNENNGGTLPPVGGDNGGNTLPPVGGDNGNTDSNENNGGTLPPVGGDNGGTDNGDTNGGDTDGGDNPNSPKAPYTYVRAALLGADGNDTPTVVMTLLDADGNKITENFPAAINIEGLDNSNYIALYDNVTGTITFTLKDPMAGATGPENFTVIVNGESYVVQVTSSAGKDLANAEWAPVDEALAYADKAWAGENGQHLQGAVIVTPEGYATTELHLQMTDSSINSVEGQNSSVSLNKGSLTISNENSALSDVHHAESVQYQGYVPEYYDTSATNFDAALVATVTATGKDVQTSLEINEGDIIINAGGTAPVLSADNVGYVSGIYSANTGQVSVAADNISVNASAQGFSGLDGKANAVITGVRSDGATREEVTYTSQWGSWSVIETAEKSTVVLEGKDSVTVTANITGDTDTQDHSGISYAAVAATERGKVEITSTEGDVNIGVTNHAEGDHLSTSGISGIFSGFGIGSRDLPSRADFVTNPEDAWGDYDRDGLNEYYYATYNRQLAEEYGADKRGEWDDASGRYLEKNGQTEVTLKAAGDVNVTVDLGDQDYDGKASGIKMSLGDVRIESGGDINISTIHNGVHNGDKMNALSAVESAGGVLTMKAEGDINLNMQGNGDNLAVVKFDALTENYYYYGVTPTNLSAKNVNFTGHAGQDGVSASHIAGIDGSNTTFKRETFTVQADEKFTIDVTAQDNGHGASSTGLVSGGGTAGLMGYSFITLGVDAPELEINARVTGDLANLSEDSRASAITSNRGSVTISSYENLDAYTRGEYNYRHGIAKPIETVKLTAEGARYNTGIEVNGSVANDGASMALVDVRARDLTIEAKGGATTGDSASYGIAVTSKGGYYGDDYAYYRNPDQTVVDIEASNLNIIVDNTQHSVGISAVGSPSEVEIRSIRHYDNDGWYEQTEPLTVTITSTITNAAEQLRGIAIEALNGGHVTIKSSQEPDWRTGQLLEPALADKIVINGDIIVSNDGADDYTADAARVTIDTGYGRDHVAINGDITMGKNAYFTVDTGAGDDVIMLNGKIQTIEDYQVNITGGEGHDMFVLQAPDAATFTEWYQGWLQMQGTMDNLNVESVIVKGVDNPSDLSWLSDIFGNYGVTDIQFVGADVNLTMVNDLSALSSLVFDGSGDNDLLYLRFDTASDPLSTLTNVVNSGKLNGLENLVIDMADGRSGELDMDQFSSLLNSMHGNRETASANVLIRADESDTLNLEAAGWSTTNQTETVNGNEYTVYTNANEGFDNLYVQLVNSSM